MIMMFATNQDDPHLFTAKPDLLPAPSPGTAVEELDEYQVTGEGWAVILFNDGAHDKDEVTMQIVLATGCPWENAEDVMIRAERHGQAVVTITTFSEAERVATVLRRIALRVAVEEI